MNLRAITLTSLFCLAASPAMAASDLIVDVIPDNNVPVYDVSSYRVKVSNIGNQNASNVMLTVQLPETNTSPTVHVMGDLTYIDSKCSLSGTELICSLGKVKKNKKKKIFFDIILPESAAPLVFDAVAATSSNENSTSNNDDSATASLVNYDVPLLGGESAFNRHCTGQGLTSFYECELYPSSISSHEIILNSGGSVTIVGQPDYSGSWEQLSDDHLSFQYTYNGQVVAEFEGYGVSSSCFEGITLFPGSPYVSPYEVCI